MKFLLCLLLFGCFGKEYFSSGATTPPLDDPAPIFPGPVITDPHAEEPLSKTYSKLPLEFRSRSAITTSQV